MNAVLGQKVFLCDLAEQSWVVKAVMIAELGLKVFVCDLAEQSCVFKAQL